MRSLCGLIEFGASVVSSRFLAARGHPMTDRIYSRLADGSVETLLEAPFETEDELQILIADHPEILPGELILVKREMGVAESVDSGYRWSLDHLFLDRDGTPTLVEVKTASNSERRREVVGQMLDYIAGAIVTWTADELRTMFEANPERGSIENHVGDLNAFWRQVDTKIRDKNFHLLFVADDIPSELERIVALLNDQMRTIKVGAIEIKRYRGESSQSFVPRVVGSSRFEQTARSASTRLTEATFMNAFPDKATRNAVYRVLDTAARSGAKLEYGVKAVSVRATCQVWEPLITLAWLYPPNIRTGGRGRTRDFSFGVEGILHDNSAPQELSATLKEWINDFANDEFSSDVSDGNIDSYSVEYEDFATHSDVIVDRLQRVLANLSAVQ